MGARKKILFLSDAVSCTSGLGRITRDLALRVHAHIPEFEVAAVGYGAPGSSSIPFKEYHLHSVDKWLAQELPGIWADFVGEEEEGILMTVWDLSRLYWLGVPQTCPAAHLRRWVEQAKMKKWVYHAIDAEGPNGKLSHRIAETMKGFDRVIDYSAFSSRVTDNPTHLPHGIDSSMFFPRDKGQAREQLAKSFVGLKPESLLVGIVATNQARKNWQLGMQTCRVLLDRGYDVRLWAHTDVLDRYWSVGNLIVDYGLMGRVAVTTQRFTDDQMAWMYAACDVTLGIGPEGFGYPIAESLACGVPVVCGSYGAQAEYVPKEMQVHPDAYYYEGAFCSKRPVHSAEAWATKVLKTVSLSVRIPEEIDWHGRVLWPAWEQWFRQGLTFEEGLA